MGSVNNPPIDVDECAEDTDGCDQTCTNSIGSYDCSCNTGYRLDTDRHTCNGDVYIAPQH